MKIKHFFRMSFKSILSSLFWLILTGFFVFVLAFMLTIAIKNSYKGWDALRVIGLILAILVFGYPIYLFGIQPLDMFFGPITLDSSEIRTKGDRRIYRKKLQHPVNIKYVDILSISIVPYGRQSNGSPTGMAKPIPYLFVKDKNRKTSRFSLHDMAKRTVRNLLLSLKERCANAGNNVDVNVEELINCFCNAKHATFDYGPKDESKEKPKRFFRLSFLSLFVHLVIAAFTVIVCVYFFPYYIRNIIEFYGDIRILWYVVMLLVALGVMTYLALVIADLYCGLITLDSHWIRTKGNSRFQMYKYQFPACVNYADIATFTIVPYMKASNGSPTNNLRPFPFLFVTDKKGKTSKFALQLMSSRTVRKLIVCLKKKCSEAGNEIEVDIDDLMKKHRQALFSTHKDAPKDIE